MGSRERGVSTMGLTQGAAVGTRGPPRALPADDGRSSQTRLVRGVLRLQSPSECTEDTDGGRSPEDRPGAGDLALRLLGLAAIFGFPPPPAKRSARSSPRPAGRRSRDPGRDGFLGSGRGWEECMHPALPQHHARFESLQLRVVAREGQGSTCHTLWQIQGPRGHEGAATLSVFPVPVVLNQQNQPDFERLKGQKSLCWVR